MFIGSGEAFGTSCAATCCASNTTPSVSFGSTPAFSAFGASNTTPSCSFGPTPAFSAPGAPAFGASNTTPSCGLFSTPAFSAPGAPAFGASNTTPSCGLFSTPAFSAPGASNTTPSCGLFSTPAFYQSASAFGSSPFGTTSTPFGAQSSAFGTQATTPILGNAGFRQSTFGGHSAGSGGNPYTPTPAFSAFGASNTTPSCSFGPTPAFYQSASAFGSSPFGTTRSPFGAQSSAFGNQATTPTLGNAGFRQSTFGGHSAGSGGNPYTPTPAFSAFGASNTTPSCSFGPTPAFYQSASAFGSSPFGTTSAPFGAQSSAFGTQATTPTLGNAGFGQSTFGGQRAGSRVTPYTPTTEVDGSSGTQPAGKLESISAMTAYKEKSHEELRWEDYHLGDKGGNDFVPSNPQSNPFASTSTINQLFPNPGFWTSSTTSAFNSTPFGAKSASNPFGSATTAPSLFGTSLSLFGATSPSLFTSSNPSTFGSSPSIFGSGSAQVTTSTFGPGLNFSRPGLNFSNTLSSPLFQSTGPTFGQTSTSFGQTTTAFGQNTTTPFGQSNIFNTPSTAFGVMFSSTPLMNSSSNPMGFSQTTPSHSTPFQPTQPAQTNSTFGIGNFGQAQGGTNGFGVPSIIFNPSNFGQLYVLPLPALPFVLPSNFICTYACPSRS